MAKRKILISISKGIVVRNIVHTGIIERLANVEGIELAIARSNRLQPLEIDEDVYQTSFTLWQKIFMVIGRHRYYKLFPSRGTKILRDQPLTNRSSFVKKLLSWPFPRSRKLFDFIVYLTHRSLSKNCDNEKRILDGADVLIVTDPTADTEVRLILAAKEANIPIIGLVRSWDNVTSKGYLNYKLDFYGVWTTQEKDALADIHQIRREMVKVVGAPHLYHLRQLYQKNGRHKKPKQGTAINVLYATVSCDINPFDTDIVQHLKVALGNKYDLRVKLHQADDPDRWNHLKSTVSFTTPPSKAYKNSSDRVSRGEFLQELFEALFWSDIIIHTCSTIALDGLCLEKRNIAICFDYGEVKKPISRFYDQEHYAALVNDGLVEIAYSMDELIAMLQSHQTQREKDVQKIFLERYFGDKDKYEFGLLDVIAKVCRN